MKKKSEHILTQQSNSSLKNEVTQTLQLNQTSKTVQKPKHNQPKTSSNPQIQHKSVYIINDNFVNKLNPKRSSIDLTSFIQVFRKKIRQTTIAREFQNSLEKFKSLSENRTTNYSRQKGGFVGSYKKQNELLVQNNRNDNQIKKIIISDLQFNQRKMKPKITFGQFPLLENQTSRQNYEYGSRDKSSRFSRKKVLTYAQSSQYEEAQSFTVSFSNKMYSPGKFKENPQNFTENLKLMNDYTPTLYHENEKKEKQGENGKKNKTSLFQNRRLETITSYQRPNLMYNLSLYRKKQSYNALKSTKKRAFHTQNDS